VTPDLYCAALLLCLLALSSAYALAFLPREGPC
jgi:hypothetical protein